MLLKGKHEYLPLSDFTLLLFQQALFYTIAVIDLHCKGLILLVNFSFFFPVGDDTSTLGMAEWVHFVLYHIFYYNPSISTSSIANFCFLC